VSVEDKIETIIDKSKKSTIFFTEDFREEGSADAIRMALSRLGKRRVIERIGKGIYVK